MIEDINDAEEELKRADHLAFVTLKYTRTTDVIKNTIDRLVNACNLVIEGALTHAKSKKKIKDQPKTTVAKYQALQKVVKSPEIKEFIKLHILLKKIAVADYEAKSEYRKHVTLIASVDGKKINVDVPTLMDYYDKSKLFVAFIKSWVLGEIR